MEIRKCAICGRHGPKVRLVPIEAVRAELGDELDKQYPGWRDKGDYICREDMRQARRAHIEELMHQNRTELTRLDDAVADAILKGTPLVPETAASLIDRPSFGDRLADHIAAFGGSWVFILGFCGMLLVWIAFNDAFGIKAFDPYPFILLNLVLSCIAALQAPLIMMSQRRQEEKDRERAQNDYVINLKAELEIRMLHEKLDHLLIHQWEHLSELQEMLMEDEEDRWRN